MASSTCPTGWLDGNTLCSTTRYDLIFVPDASGLSLLVSLAPAHLLSSPLFEKLTPNSLGSYRSPNASASSMGE